MAELNAETLRLAIEKMTAARSEEPEDYAAARFWLTTYLMNNAKAILTLLDGLKKYRDEIPHDDGCASFHNANCSLQCTRQQQVAEFEARFPEVFR